MTSALDSILLIEDDEATNFLNQIIIKECNCFKDIHIYFNAQDALLYLTAMAKYKDYAGVKFPRIILLDLNLPGMDGWEFLEHFKKLNLCGIDNSIVAVLTISPKENNLGKIMEYDFLTDYLEKPLTFEKLNQIIRISGGREKA